jgi:hypothetical protein
MTHLAGRLMRSPEGEPVAFDVFAKAQRQVPEKVLLMAVQYVRSKTGAERIYRAELAGRRRPLVLATAMIRLDDFTRPRMPRGEAIGQEIQDNDNG